MGLAALEADYLFVGQLMVERLIDRVPDIPVELVERPEQVLEADKRARVLMVMWAGDRFAEGETGRATLGGSQVLYQRWMVFIGVNNVGKAADARTESVGPLLTQVHKALAGWTPPGAFRPLLRANARTAPAFTERKAVLPLGFEISLSL